MKTNYIFLLVLCLFITGNMEAQILKKLKKRAEQAVERTILRKTDEKVSEKTEQTIDSMTAPKSKKSKTKKNKTTEDQTSEDKKAGGILDILLSQTPKDAGSDTNDTDEASTGETIPAPPDNNVVLPDSYNFSYLAIVQVKSNQGTIETEYYLQPDENYYAKKLPNENFTEDVVYDNQRKMEVHFADIKGEKKKARKKMDLFTKAKMVGAYRDAPNRKVKSIGTKTLLGYNCNGYEIATDAGTTQLWITNEAPATLYRAMFEKRAETPDSPFTKKTMIMEISFASAESSDKNYTMACTQLKANTITFSTNDYKE